MFTWRGITRKDTVFIVIFILILAVIPNFSDKNNFILGKDTINNSKLIFSSTTEIRNYSIISQWQNSYDNTLDVFVVNEYAYLADKEGGLVILDLSNLTAPREIGRYFVSEDIVGAVNLFVDDDFAFVANDVDGARIIDVSNKTDPQLESEYHDETYYWDVYTENNYAYFTTIGDGLEILDISDKSNPIEIAEYNSGGFIWSIWGSGNYLYTADLTYGLEVLNIAEKTTPTKIGSYNDFNGQPISIIVEDNLAFLAEGNAGLEILNISTVTSPVEICQYTGSSSIVDVEYNNETIFLADKYEGLIVLDYSNKTNPIKVGSYNLECDVSSVFFDGEYAFLTTGENGLMILGLDSDNDDLSDYLELEVYFTDYLNPDSDGDGFLDGYEVKHGTDPLDPNDYPIEPTNAAYLFDNLKSISIIILAPLIMIFSNRKKKKL